jgi:glucokinase
MNVIGIDVGGTKVAAGLVSKEGKILRELRMPTRLADGWPGLRAQLVEICRELKDKKTKAVGIGSAGPLHAPTGKLLDPTNFGWAEKKGGAKPISMTAELKKILKMPVHLENDAAATALAERWKGGGGDDFVVLTLGTGLGMGVINNGKLVRGGRELHPEGGHVLLRSGDPTAPCGCGLYGCAEAFLAGRNFDDRAEKKLGLKLKGTEWAAKAEAGDEAASALFAEYSELLADYLLNLVVLYYPKTVIFAGSFAAAHPQFLPAAKQRLKLLLERRLKTVPLLPVLRPSKLGARSPILGGAYVALHS